MRAARLAALRAYRILDTEPEQAFDDSVAARVAHLQTPIALISLVDEDRQWFKSRVGISVDRNLAQRRRSARTPSSRRGIFVVPDALDDDRFRDNPFVRSDPHIRFYAGAPLVTPDGHALGTLCVIDRVPRTLTEDQKHALDALRRQAEAQLELRRNLLELAGPGRARSCRGRASRPRRRTARLARQRQQAERTTAALLRLRNEHGASRPTPVGIQHGQRRRHATARRASAGRKTRSSRWISRCRKRSPTASVTAARATRPSTSSASSPATRRGDWSSSSAIRGPASIIGAVANPLDERQHDQAERPRRVPDQSADGRSGVRRWRPRSADA